MKKTTSNGEEYCRSHDLGDERLSLSGGVIKQRGLARGSLEMEATIDRTPGERTGGPRWRFW